MKRFIRILPLIVAIAATSCASRDIPGDEERTDCGYILFGFGGSTSGISWETSSETRVTSTLSASVPESAGVFGYNNFTGGQSYPGSGEVFNNVRLYRRDGALFAESGISEWYDNPDTGHELPTDGTPNMWPYTPPMPWLFSSTGVRYKFFAYAPYAAGDGEMEVTGRSYDSFERVVWRHVPKYGSDDHVISDRLCEYVSKPSDNDLQQLELQHLQSRIRFCFRLGNEFSTLRMIRVKRLEIISQQGFLYTIAIRYAPVEEYGVTVYRPSVSWTIEDKDQDQDFSLVNDQDPATLEPVPYIELSKLNNTQFLPLASMYAFPYDDLESVKIRVVYDVYDYYPEEGKEPVLLRENDTAENTVPLGFRAYSSAAGTGPRLQPGHCYDVRIKIEPSYLYVLSDNDFDADGHIVIKDD